MNSDMDKRYLVLGVGLTGASVVRYLLQHGVSVRAADSREKHDSVLQLAAEFPALDLQVGAFSDELLRDVDVLVVNPGLSLRLPVVQEAQRRGIEVLGDIELFARAVSCPVVAVSGTNGKSTVVSMLQAMGARSDKRVLCGGNIGEPALNLLNQEADAIVLELSSYQLESTSSLKALASSILNVSEDHMDRYEDLEHYARAKQTIYAGAGVAVYLLEDELSHPRSGDGRAVSVSAEPDARSDYGLVDGQLCRDRQPVFDLSELGAPGAHNELNAGFAWALGEALGLSAEAMAQGLRDFVGLEHRTQLVAEIDGIRFYNDSKGTNVGATLVALRSMPGKTILLAGGDGKSQDFSPLQPALKAHARALVTYGVDGDKIAAIAPDSVPVFSAASLEAAVSYGRQQARRGDCVLLSPACASFDMFSSYQQRGHAFVDCVRGLQA